MAKNPMKQTRLLTLGGALLTLAIAIVVTFGVMSHVGASHKGDAATQG